MKISQTLTIKAPVDILWSKLVDDFVPVHEWMASIKNSTARPGPVIAGAPAAGRNAEVGAGAPGTIMEETFTALDKQAGVIEFDTVLNSPNFNPIKGWSNRITLEAQGNQTKVIWSINVRLRLMGILMFFPIKKSLTAGFLRSLEEVAHIVETGTPHPRKVKNIKEEGHTTSLEIASA